ncbi:hypothetical protein [Saccharibacillus brassicae]|uniref:Uncharacterized protein n=1 Tax=Saccharibacillus brassicae TaxID=2583377 RepID=A0A4Y6UV99_SACBS|nr:hypothetical protein [Saccharibacillus brassicae]QDH21639.1 hypothetical protein FFV09_12765 [Saccharibacillus brassicae]
MMKLSSMSKIVDDVNENDWSSPAGETLWAHDPGSVRFWRIRSNAACTVDVNGQRTWPPARSASDFAESISRAPMRRPAAQNQTSGRNGLEDRLVRFSLCASPRARAGPRLQIEQL